MAEKSTNIQGSFDETLEKTELAKISMDLSELGLDNLLDDSILKDIPIVSTVHSLTKIGVNIHDRLFLKKILAFLNIVQAVSPEARQAMIFKIDTSKEYRIKVGEKLLYILDSCEDHVNAEYIGRLFLAFLREEISYQEFMDASAVMKNLSSADLNEFLSFKDKYFGVDEAGSLIGTGLIYLEFDEVQVSVRDEDDYKALLDGGSKYVSEVDGGKMWAVMTPVGEIVKSVLGDSK